MNAPVFFRRGFMNPSKALYFLIELLTCYSAVFYSNFLFFVMQIRFGFTATENLMLAALNGVIYIFAAWQGGSFAQRFGCTRSLYAGYSGFALALVLGLILNTTAGQVAAYCVWTISVCFIWPALEAIVTDGEQANVCNMVGYYNITWALGGAVAFFTAGMLLERCGIKSLYFIPLILISVQLVLLPFAAKLTKKHASSAQGTCCNPPECDSMDARHFLHLAWIANPLSYVAINTALPLFPSIATKLGLGTGIAGIICSIWMFARLTAFIILKRWTSWHYKFGLLAGSFAAMVASFAGIVLAHSIFVLIVAQIGFGLSIGLIYYSSLYYSMNVSSERGAHGGLHEAMIGAGLFAGPAFGAVSVLLLPAANPSIWAVSGLLTAGFSGFLLLRRHQENR